MKSKIVKTACFALIAASLIAAPAITLAADSTNTPAAAAPKPNKPRILPFHGAVVAVDAAAMTFTVGTLTIAIASTSKITKEGKPAIFADITVGEHASGSYKKDAAGKLTTNSVRLGQPKPKETPPAAPATAPMPAPAPAPAPATK